MSLSHRGNGVGCLGAATSAGPALAASGCVDGGWANGLIPTAPNIGWRTSSSRCCCCAAAVAPRLTAQLTIGARCGGQACGTSTPQAGFRWPARLAGCSCASASVHRVADGSWPRPATGGTRHGAAPLPPSRHIPHPLTTPARGAHRFALPPFDIQVIFGGASGPRAPRWVATSARCCDRNGRRLAVSTPHTVQNGRNPTQSSILLPWPGDAQNAVSGQFSAAQ